MKESMPWLAGVDRSEWTRAAAIERTSRGSATEHAGYRAPADRPRQRRDGEAPGTAPWVTVRAQKIELRASGGDKGQLTYEGWASVTDTPYEMWDYYGPYTEQVMSGAFTKTLAQVEPPLDVPLVLQHDPLRRIARTTNGSLQLDEDEIGLHVLADQLDPSDADVAYIAPKLRSSLVDEMSFKFMITKGSWSPDWMEFHINEVDIHRGDVAIVAYGANPATAGAGLRTAPAGLIEGLTDEQARVVLRKLNERLGPIPVARSRGQLLISENEVRPRTMP